MYCSALEKTNSVSSFLGIQKYADTFSLVGGVNAPKKVECVGTDGIKRPQLVKVEYLFTVACTREYLCFYMWVLSSRYVQTSELYLP
jgi:hypothetical protein